MHNYPEFMDTETAANYLGMSKAYLEIGRCKGYGPYFVKVTPGRNANAGSCFAARRPRCSLHGFMLCGRRGDLPAY